jgi:hypothetical protein
VYWIVGLNPSAKAFFIFAAMLILEGLASQGLGVAVSAACKTEKIAFAAAPGITVILMLFGAPCRSCRWGHGRERLLLWSLQAVCCTLLRLPPPPLLLPLLLPLLPPPLPLLQRRGQRQWQWLHLGRREGAAMRPNQAAGLEDVLCSAGWLSGCWDCAARGMGTRRFRYRALLLPLVCRHCCCRCRCPCRHTGQTVGLSHRKACSSNCHP